MNKVETHRANEATLLINYEPMDLGPDAAEAAAPASADSERDRRQFHQACEDRDQPELWSQFLGLEAKLERASGQREAFRCLMELAVALQDLEVRQYILCDGQTEATQATVMKAMGAVKYVLKQTILRVSGRCDMDVELPANLSIGRRLTPAEELEAQRLSLFNGYPQAVNGSVVGKPPVLGLRKGQYIVLAAGELSPIPGAKET